MVKSLRVSRKVFLRRGNRDRAFQPKARVLTRLRAEKIDRDTDWSEMRTKGSEDIWEKLMKAQHPSDDSIEARLERKQTEAWSGRNAKW